MLPNPSDAGHLIDIDPRYIQLAVQALRFYTGGDIAREVQVIRHLVTGKDSFGIPLPPLAELRASVDPILVPAWVDGDGLVEEDDEDEEEDEDEDDDDDDDDDEDFEDEEDDEQDEHYEDEEEVFWKG